MSEEDTEEKLYCGLCGDECDGKFEDFGIGSYEYWGAPCRDVDVRWVSDCCETDIYTDPELTQLADEPEQEEPDYPEEDPEWDDPAMFDPESEQ